MTKSLCTRIALFVLAICAMAAADTVSVFPASVGNLGSSTYTASNGVVVTGLYYNSTTGTWLPANLFGRNQADDHGLGICNPAETTSCGTGSGNGDINELDNNGKPELIRLTLPTGFDWTTIQVSSLDKNGSTNPALWERGRLWSDSDGNPNSTSSPGDNVVCSFSAAGVVGCSATGGTSFEPQFLVPSAYSGSQYLFLQAYDWQNGTNNNNDYLLYAAGVERSQVPEPSSMILLGSGMFGALGAIRRKLNR